MIEKHEKDFIAAYRVSSIHNLTDLGAYDESLKGVRAFKEKM